MLGIECGSTPAQKNLHWPLTPAATPQLLPGHFVTTHHAMCHRRYQGRGWMLRRASKVSSQWSSHTTKELTIMGPRRNLRQPLQLTARSFALLRIFSPNIRLKNWPQEVMVEQSTQYKLTIGVVWITHTFSCPTNLKVWTVSAPCFIGSNNANNVSYFTNNSTYKHKINFNLCVLMLITLIPHLTDIKHIVTVPISDAINDGLN